MGGESSAAVSDDALCVFTCGHLCSMCRCRLLKRIGPCEETTTSLICTDKQKARNHGHMLVFCTSAFPMLDVQTSATRTYSSMYRRDHREIEVIVASTNGNPGIISMCIFCTSCRRGLAGPSRQLRCG